MPYLVADGLALVACGTEQVAVAQAVQVGRHCVDRCEAGGMVVSRIKSWEDCGEGKSMALASTPTVRKRLSTSTRAMGIPVKRRTNNRHFNTGSAAFAPITKREWGKGKAPYTLAESALWCWASLGGS